MPLEIIALIEKPHLRAIVLVMAAYLLAVGAFIGVVIERRSSRRRRRGWRRRPFGAGRRKNVAAPAAWRGERPDPGPAQRISPPDAADQLRIVMAAEFTVQPVLNRSEARLFKELDRAVLALNPAWQVMAQVSLGEILRSKDAEAYGCINSKRVDLLLMDSECRPRHAIEYQGGAHHQGAAAARDAVKKEALRRAGVGYHEVVAGDTTPAELRRLVERLVERPPT